jgi:hypothetical protein
MRQTRIVTWCVLRSGRKPGPVHVAHHFFSRRRAAEDFAASGDSLYKVTWRNLEGGVKSIVASLANLAVLPSQDASKRLTSMATWELVSQGVK